jgi:hypothetical protein
MYFTMLGIAEWHLRISLDKILYTRAMIDVVVSGHFTIGVYCTSQTYSLIKINIIHTCVALN